MNAPLSATTVESEQPSHQSVLERMSVRLRPESPAAVVQRVMLTLLVVLVVALCFANPTFRLSGNLLNIVQQASMVGVIACGMQLMIISGGFDLSVGVIASAAGCAAAHVSIERGVLLGIFSGLAVGLLAGSINGVLVAKLHINPFVATFGTLAVITGLVLGATSGRPIAPLPPEWVQLGLNNVAGLSFASIVFIVVVIAVMFILRYTRFGKHVYAVGSNKEGTRRAGINVDRTLIAVYAIGGLTAGIAGVILVALTGIGSPGAGRDWALLAIAAVIIGGTPLTGGVGGVSAGVIGILTLTVITNALNLYSVSPYWQPAIIGGAVLLTVGYESYRRDRNA